MCKLSVRERVCAFRTIIKRNFVAKSWIWFVVCIICLLFICLASVVVGFGYFAVLGCKDLWNNTNHLAKWYGHVMRCLELPSPCVSLKIIAHLRTFDSQSDSSIQRPHSIKDFKCTTWRLRTAWREEEINDKWLSRLFHGHLPSYRPVKTCIALCSESVKAR